MNRNKCPRCGLVNVATDKECRRCGELLGASVSGEAASSNETETRGKKRGLFRRLLWIVAVTVSFLFLCYASLLATSEPLGLEQRELVDKAIGILEEKGFDSESSVLRHLVTYRSTDNWWNKYVGHRDAYAATNFPFEVLTLYPKFFKDSVDDNERAAMLLHESLHLFGSGEERALESVWREKRRLGWTTDKYAESKVWKSTRELTMSLVPSLFQCGPDGRSDWVE